MILISVDKKETSLTVKDGWLEIFCNEPRPFTSFNKQFSLHSSLVQWHVVLYMVVL